MPKGMLPAPGKPSNLTDYIRRDLENRIASGELGSADLSLHALAGYYKVSITPLRNAINELVGEGIITKLPNRRLQVGPRKGGKAGARRAAPVPPTPRDWDEVLIKEVMRASLGQGSAYLREDSLSRKLGIGRSIIRQSLSRFAGAGLIDHIPRRGWFVHPLGIEDMHAYLLVRELLELKALRLARPNMDMAELRGIRALAANTIAGGQSELDNSIHEYFIDKSGNRYIRQFFQQYVARYYTELFYYAAPETSIVEKMAHQHAAIIDALLARKWAQAEKLLSEHIRYQSMPLMKLLGQAEGPA
jgi:DNA-binding GntR family transcriptional regulator